MKNIIKYENLQTITINGKKIEFIHGKDGDNYFNANTIATILNEKPQNIRKHLRTYAQKINNVTNSNIVQYRQIKIPDVKQKVRFYPFMAVAYVAFRVNTPEAFNFCYLINKLLNEEFNKEYQLEELPAVLTIIDHEKYKPTK